MKRLLALLASLAAVKAAASPAQKLPLTGQNLNCDGSPAQPPTSVSGGGGFVVLVKTGSNKLVANVVLQNAIPHSTYGIRLIQLGPQSVSDCGIFSGPYEDQLTTDSSGNGNANYQEAVINGATAAFIALNNIGDPAHIFFTTPVATF